MTLEELVVKISGETSGLQSAMGSAISAVGKFSAAAVAAGATAVAALTKSAVESYADYEQLVGGVETLFKDSAGIVQEYAANAFQTAGLSANDYMETVTGFSASLLQSVGGDTEEAARIADQAITDMADNANKMGSSMESIQNAYQGFAKQNYTMLDNLKLGYGGTKQEMERLLADAEKLSGVHYDISNLNDVYEAIHVIQGELGITGTTAEEASTTIQGSAAAMKAAWQNMLTGIADENADFDGLINNLVKSIETFAQNIIPRVEQALKGIGKLVSGLAPIIVQELPNLISEILPSFIEAVMSIVDSIIGIIPELLPVVLEAITEIGMEVINSLSEILPDILQAVIDGVIQVANTISENLPQIVAALTQGLLQLVQVIIDNMPQFLQAALQLFISIQQAIFQAMPIIIAALPQLIIGIVDFIVGAIPQLIQAYIQLLSSLVDALPEIIAAIVAALPQIIDGIITALLEGLPLIIQCGIQLFIALIQNIGEIISGIAKALPDLIAGIVEAILEHLPEIIECGVQLFIALIANLPTIIVELVKAVPQIIQALLEAFGEGVSKFGEMGVNLVKGLWNGFKSKLDEFFTNAKQWFSNGIAKIKNSLGIHSPSTVFAGIGKYLVLGLDEGITDNISSASKAMEQMSNAVEAAFNPNLEIPTVEDDMGLSNVRLRASITPTLTDATGLEIDSQNKLETAFRNGNSDIISTLIQTTQQLIQAIEDKDTSIAIGDDAIANAAARGNRNYKRRTGKALI